MSDRTKDREAVDDLHNEIVVAGATDEDPTLSVDHAIRLLALARAHLAMLDAGPKLWATCDADGDVVSSDMCVWETEEHAYDLDEERGEHLVPLYAPPEKSDG